MTKHMVTGSQRIGEARPLTSNAVVACAIVTGLTIVALGSIGPNLDLAAASAASLVLGAALLWRPGEPPILLLVFLFQWMQGSIAILQATLAGQTIDALYPGAGPVGEATFLTLAALSSMAIGMRIAAGPVAIDLKRQTQAQLARGSGQKWFVLFVQFWALGLAARMGMQMVPALSQVLLGVDAMRWAFFFLLGVVSFQRGGKSLGWFAIAFVVEFGLSLGGFFSSFKTVFFVTFLAAMAAGVRVSIGRLLLAACVGVAAFGMGVVWTAIKPEYRSFASGGLGNQTISVSYPEQIAKLGELIGELDNQAMADGTQKFLSRLSYVEFFGSTLAHVPAMVPHENGALLMDAVSRPFMPRALFPEKTPIDDSERTRYYTGRFVSGAETGTSISLGWVAEVYVDFGKWGMFLGALAIGAFYGLVHRFLTGWRQTKGALGLGMSIAALLPVALLETSITKALGGVIASLLAAFAIALFVVPLVGPWLVRSPRGSQQRLTYEPAR